MIIGDIAFIAADTTRSRAYLHSLLRHGLMPSFILLLTDVKIDPLPCQENIVICADNKYWAHYTDCEYWSEAGFDYNVPITNTMHQNNIPYVISPSSNINDAAVVSIIASASQGVFIYSGFGGVLLKKNLLLCGKKFLHVHGGYLPDYKGSTTNFYSLLCEGKMGASSMFLTENIDSGPIIQRLKFPSPPDRTDIDHRYDSAARAKVLINCLKDFIALGKWEFDQIDNRGGEVYYVIHPILKHVAILS